MASDDGASKDRAGFEESFDLVSIGSGVGGLSAAITAAQEGAKALVLEWDDVLGGVTARSGGHIWVGDNHLAADAGIEDSFEEAAEYLTYLASDSVDSERRDGYIEGAKTTLRYMLDEVGLSLRLLPEWPDSFNPRAPGSKAGGRVFLAHAFPLSELSDDLRARTAVSPHGYGYISYEEVGAAEGDFETIVATATAHAEAGEVVAGTGLTARLIKAADDRGVELRTNCRVTRLLGDGTGVIGVEVDTPEGTTTIGARGVVVATGGYDWNPELFSKYEGFEDIRSMAPPTTVGDHLRMAAEVGGVTASAVSANTPIFLGFQTPGEELDGGPAFRAVFPTPGSILVNDTGRRFADESAHLQLSNEFKGDLEANLPAWLVFDERHHARFSVGNLPPGAEIPGELAVSAATPRELAERAGFDADGFEETLERLNRFAAAGVDEDFGRGSLANAMKISADSNTGPNKLLGPVDTPPYYAIPLTVVAMGIPTAGLKIDTIGRVLNGDDAPIPGLYAAGNAAARLDVGGYQDGIGNGRGLVYGHLAAMDVAGRP